MAPWVSLVELQFKSLTNARFQGTRYMAPWVSLLERQFKSLTNARFQGARYGPVGRLA